MTAAALETGENESLERIIAAYGRDDAKAFNKEVDVYATALQAKMPSEMAKVPDIASKAVLWRSSRPQPSRIAVATLPKVA